MDVATDLDGKRIVLTGASEGIGRDVALQLAAAGARVVVCARNKTKLDAVSAEAAGGRVVAVQADLSTAEGVMRCLSFACLLLVLASCACFMRLVYQSPAEGVMRCYTLVCPLPACTCFMLSKFARRFALV